ncbi:hypothetical protein M3Y94_01268600 [Aphelenchoides besseyi]|nr:hypothetical protein M3Y94_01268600 [Aphelenchoides besseyi]KAI6222612.1 Nucleoporin-C domain-containing protein [Aphelenchoides besseyi]
MTDLVLRSDPYDAEYPSLVREMLTNATNPSHLFAQITKDGYCAIMYNKYIYVWSYATEDSSMPHAFSMQMPSTGLQYTSSQLCVYKKSNVKMPSVLCVSPEGILRHWPEVGKPFKDHNLDLNNEVAHSLVVFEEKNHVHRFLLCTTTCTFFIVEVFHDGKQKEHLVTRGLDLNTNVGVSRRMSILLFGNANVNHEHVVKMLVTTDLIEEVPEAELCVLFYKSIRIYSVNESRLIHECNLSDFVNNALVPLISSPLPKDLKYHLLNATVYENGLLLIVAVNVPPSEMLDFYLFYITSESFGQRRTVQNCIKIPVPPHLQILSPFHESSLPRVLLNIPKADECAVIFPNFVILITNPTDREPTTILEEFNDSLLGAASLNNLCHLVLAETGICALRRLPRLFDLSFWKKHRNALKRPTNEFLGRDFDKLQSSFFKFCAKDLAKARRVANDVHLLPADQLSTLIVSFAQRYINGVAPGDPRWCGEATNITPADRELMILTDFRDKLAFYRMFFLFLSYMGLVQKIEIPLAEHGERTARTLLVEFGEKLLSMMDCFQWLISGTTSPVVENAITQLARRFASLYDHPTNRNLTNYDHFFKEVTAFEELIPELVRCETEELDQCAHDTPSQARVIAEVGAILTKVADAVSRARDAEWSAPPIEGSSTWINQPRSMKYFIQHLQVSFNLLGQRENLIGVVNDQVCDSILLYTVSLARLVLGEQDHCQRNNSQIIAKFYEIGQTELALELALEFQDFTLLIRHSHTALTGDERHEFVENLKRRFKDQNFEMHLYEYYRRNKMVDYLLEERGENLDNFLAHHEDIGWIRSIESHKYRKARQTLANLVLEAKDPEKKITIAALAKMCALCETDHDPKVVNEFSETIAECLKKLPQPMSS